MDTNGNTKELLIKDLSSRLPYGVKVNGVFLIYDKDKDKILYKECVKELNYNHLRHYGNLKPYLFPLSSMTEEQYDQLYIDSRVKNDSIDILDTLANDMDAIDWLNKNHFDYRGLIEKSLALDATNLGIYEREY